MVRGRTEIESNSNKKTDKEWEREREREINFDTPKLSNGKRTIYIAKKINDQIYNEALNNVTIRRVEWRFLPSVRAAGENGNRKKIQNLPLKVETRRIWDVFFVFRIFDFF